MTMDSWGGEDSGALMAQQEEEARLERERLAAYQAGPLPPPPPTTGQPAGNFFGQQFQQPPPPVGDLMAPLMPPAPPSTPLGVSQNLDLPSMTVDPSQAAWWTSPTAQNLLSAPAYSGDTPVAAPNYTGVYGPDPNYIPPEVLQGFKDLGYGGGLANSVGSAIVGGVGQGVSAALNSPALNFFPGGNLLSPAGVESPSVMGAYSSEIPFLSPFSRDVIQPAAGFIGEQGGQYLNTIGGGLPNQIMGAIGAPSYQELGRGGAEAAVPVTLGDYAFNALAVPKGAGLAERLTGFGGLDDLAQTPLANLARDAARAGMPSPNLLSPGLNIGVGGPMDFRQQIERELNYNSPNPQVAADLSIRANDVNRALQDEARLRLGATGDLAMQDAGELRALPNPQDLADARASRESLLATAPTEQLQARLAQNDDYIYQTQQALESVARGQPLDQQTADLMGFSPDFTAEERAAALRSELISTEADAAAIRDQLATRFGFPTEQGGIRFAVPPEGRAGGLDPYDTGQQFGYNPAQPNFQGMPSRFDTAPPEVQAEIRAAQVAADEDAKMVRGLNQPLTENVPAPPDIYGRTFYDNPEVGPARTGAQLTDLTPQTPSIPVNANEMQQALDANRALESAPAGGGTPPAPTAAEAGLAPPASPPPASLTPSEGQVVRIAVQPDAVKPLEDFIAPGKGFELTDPAKARILGEGETVEPGEILMLHGTGNAGIQGDLRVGTNLTNDPAIANRSAISEARLEGTAGAGGGAGAPPASPPEAHWFNDPRFPLIDEADPPPMTFQQLLENSRGGAGGGIPPTGVVPPAAVTPPPPGGPPGAAAAGPTGAREEYFARLRAERDAAGGAPPPPTPPANPIAAAGPPPSVAANPQAASLWDNMMDLLYGPLQMDVGTPFRQNLSATLDLSKIGRTREVLGDAVLAASGRAEAVRVMQDLDRMVADAAKSIGHNKPNLHLPDIPGVKVTRGNVGREVNQSNLFGQIPGIGAAYNVTGRANAMVLYSQRARDYVDFVKNLPDRAFATKDSSKWAAQAQYFANQRAVTSGRGSLMGKPLGIPLEKTLAAAGPVFTSLRYLLSLPQRVPYLIPVNRVAAGQWEVFGPAWREAAKEHAFFAAALAGTYKAAEMGGFKITNKDDEIDGKIRLPGGLTVDLTGGASTWYNTIQKMADGDLNAGAEFLRNKSGPGVQAIAQGLKLAGVEGKAIDFMRPDWFDKGATGSGMTNRSGKGTDLDRAAALIMPLFMQSAAKAYRAAEMSGKNPWNAAATAGAADFVGVNTRANPMNTRTPALNSAMADPENLKGLPPNVVEFLTGKDWTAATPDEQRAIRANLSPEKLAEVERGEQQLRDRNDIFQAGRDQSKQIADTAAAKRAELQPVADKLLADWNAGRDPSKTVAQMKQIEKAADEAANKVYTGTQRIYDSKEYQDKIKDFPDKGAAQKEVDQIRELSKQYNDLYNDKRVVKADGSRDYDKLGAMQAAMLDVIRKDDPGFATRLEFNLQPNPANSFELTHQIKSIEATLDKKGYYDVPTGSKTQYAREHADVDALLSWLYGNPVHSQAAAQILQSLAPQRTVQYAR